MPGNTFGKLFRITTFGESHGNAVGVLIDGVKPNLKFSVAGIQRELDRRRPGQSTITTNRQETDIVEVLSGVFEHRTLGTPICLLIRNINQDSRAYNKIKTLFRPGHAGYSWLARYGIEDYRGGGRASGRETVGRVAAGGFAKQLLKKYRIQIIAYTKEIAGIAVKKIDYDEIENNSVRCPDRRAAAAMVKRIEKVKKEGDSIGGIVEAVILHCPPGVGDPVFNKLDADFAKALMSIPAIKGFEIGSGFTCATMKGSEHNDRFYVDRKKKRIGTRTNFAGGLLGGISSGEPIIMRVAVKPPSSIPKQQTTIDLDGHRRVIRVQGRHDPCLCPRIVPVVESMLALVLADHLLLTEKLKNKKSRR
jgi:chorismate synthase